MHNTSIKIKNALVGLVGLDEQMIDNLLPSILLTNLCEIVSICDLNQLILKEIGNIKSGTYYPRFKHKLEITSITGNTICIDDLSKIEITSKNINHCFGLSSKKSNTVYHKSPLKSGYGSAGYGNEIASFLNAIANHSNFEITLESMESTYNALEDVHKQIKLVTGQPHN